MIEFKSIYEAMQYCTYCPFCNNKIYVRDSLVGNIIQNDYLIHTSPPTLLDGVKIHIHTSEVISPISDGIFKVTWLGLSFDCKNENCLGYSYAVAIGLSNHNDNKPFVLGIYLASEHLDYHKSQDCWSEICIYYDNKLNDTGYITYLTQKDSNPIEATKLPFMELDKNDPQALLERIKNIIVFS